MDGPGCKKKSARAISNPITGPAYFSDCLVLGNIDSKRDWGHARDYVKGMFMMMRHDE